MTLEYQMASSSTRMLIEAVTDRHWQGGSPHALPSHRNIAFVATRIFEVARGALHLTSLTAGIVEVARKALDLKLSPTGVGVVSLVGRLVHRPALPLNNLGDALAFFWI